MDFSGLYQIDHKKKKNKIAVFFRQYGVPVVIVLFIAFLLQLVIRTLLVFPVKLQTDSMEPFLKRGESVFLVYPSLAKPVKGDVVFVAHDQAAFLCRIEAGEGDIVQILNKSLFINHIQKKDYSIKSRDKTIFPGDISTRDNTEEFLVGPQSFFCLNENWENMQDSRTWGPLSYAEIHGKVIFRKYPRN